MNAKIGQFVYELFVLSWLVPSLYSLFDEVCDHELHFQAHNLVPWLMDRYKQKYRYSCLVCGVALNIDRKHPFAERALEGRRGPDVAEDGAEVGPSRRLDEPVDVLHVDPDHRLHQTTDIVGLLEWQDH